MSTAELSSSSELLNDNWWCTGLQCDWQATVLHGVEGSKEMHTLLETWWTLKSLSERSGYVEIYNSTLISFIFQGEFTLKGSIKCGHEVTK